MSKEDIFLMCVRDEFTHRAGKTNETDGGHAVTNDSRESRIEESQKLAGFAAADSASLWHGQDEDNILLLLSLSLTT